MENQTIIENNRLIAEFLGVKPNDGGEYEMYQVLDFIEDEPTSKHFYFASEMKFHTSWDWLMPCVEKIETLLTDDSVIVITHKTCEIPVLNAGFDIVANGSTKLEAIYRAVTDFIKWYNQQ